MMARRKITEMTPLKEKGLKGYEAVWMHVRSFGNKPFTLPDVANRTNAHRDTVREYLKKLVRAGYLEEIGTVPLKGSPIPKTLYQSIQLPHEAPRLRRDGSHVEQGSGQDHMWRAIKMLKSFSVQDLAIHASTNKTSVTEYTAQSYITMLVRAGYLKCLKPAKKGGLKQNRARAVYSLLPGKNTGPKAPMIQRTKQLFDPNLSEVVWPKGGFNE